MTKTREEKGAGEENKGEERKGNEEGEGIFVPEWVKAQPLYKEKTDISHKQMTV